MSQSPRKKQEAQLQQKPQKGSATSVSSGGGSKKGGGGGGRGGGKGGGASGGEGVGGGEVKPSGQKKDDWPRSGGSRGEGEASGSAAGVKKKPTTKEERRALQEAQRKAKAERLAAQGKSPTKKQGAGGGGEGGAAKASGGGASVGGGRGEGGSHTEGKPQSHSRQRNPSTSAPSDTKPQSKTTKKPVQEPPAVKQIQLFSHLPQYGRDRVPTSHMDTYATIHPAVVKLGLQYSHGIICGSNARCVAMVAAFKKVIQDYTTPPQKELRRDLDAHIRPFINFLIQCRPLSVSMGNAIKHLKRAISEISPDQSETAAKKELCKLMDEYVNVRIKLADQEISSSGQKIIKNNDVILVYAFSSVVLRVLLDAHKAEKQFRVIVVDSRPKLEGRHMLKKLVQNGVKCSYVFINAVSYIMREVSKVIVGAHSLLANGYVMSRIGTSVVALAAKSFNVPVLVCCETYKFSDKVQTDSFIINELGDPNDLVPIGRRQGNFLTDWKDIPSLGLLNLVYDVTSPDLVAMVITEVGVIPCTSVPVILRVTRDMQLS